MAPEDTPEKLPHPHAEIFIVSNQTDYRDHFVELLGKFGDIQLIWLKNNIELIENPHLAQQPVLALISQEDNNESPIEWLQNLKTIYPKCKIFVTYASSYPKNMEELNKNGVDKIFHLHFDSDLIETSIARLLPSDILKNKVPLSLLMPINLKDLETDTELSFDAYVHLPNNKKTILLKKEGQTIDQRTIDKLRENHAQLYIKKHQVRKYMDYSVAMASLRGPNPSSSANSADGPDVLVISEKLKEHMHRVSRELFSPRPFNFQDGKLILEQSLNLLRELQLLNDHSTDQQAQILNGLCGNIRSVYNDIVGVTLLSGIISQLLGTKQKLGEGLLLAGLFHNLGLSSIGRFKLIPNYEKVNSEFRRYPSLSLQILSEKKIPLDRDFLTAIEQHREHLDGTGFPQGANLVTISEPAKILRLALRIIELTSFHSQEEVPYFSLRSSLDFLREESLGGPSPHDLSMIMILFKKFK